MITKAQRQEVLLTFARDLHDARLEGRELERLTLKLPDLSLSEAYEIQERGMIYRESEGEQVVGYKMGLTSEAKRQQMNLHSPIYGVLTDLMEVKASDGFRLQGSIHPKIEPEIAFRTNKALRGKITRDEAISACVGATAALEILDSRFKDFKYFSLEDVVADNSSSSHFIVGRTWTPFSELDLSALVLTLSHDGEVVQKAEGRAISGDPILSLVQLCELLDQRGLGLPAGSIVLAGAATAAVQLKLGSRIELSVPGLDTLEIQVK